MPAAEPEEANPQKQSPSSAENTAARPDISDNSAAVPSSSGVLDLKDSGAIALIKDILNSGSAVSMRVSGRSMEPTLRGGDVITLRRMPYSSVRVGDIVLFQDRAKGTVLHRVLRVSRGGDGITAKGDALVMPDAPFGPDALLATAVGVQFGDKDGRADFLTPSYRFRAALIARYGMLRYGASLLRLRLRDIFNKPS